MSVSNMPLEDTQLAPSVWRRNAAVPLAHRGSGRNRLYREPGGGEKRVYSAAFDTSRQTHETIGILLFGLVLLRILWRLLEPTPEPPPMAPWMKLSAGAAHLALYALLLAIPLTAIGGAWLENHPLTIFGIGNIGPMLLAGAGSRSVGRLHPHDPGQRHHLAGRLPCRRGFVSSLFHARQYFDLDAARLDTIAGAASVGGRDTSVASAWKAINDLIEHEPTNAEGTIVRCSPS